jgi:SAM-dependent methyltransferase
VEVRQWDSTQPPPADLGPVDTILCSNVLEHIPDEHAALENMRKLLRDSGQIVFVLPRGANLYGTLDKALEHCRRYDEASFRERLAGVGLEVTTSFTVNKPSVPAWFVNGRIFKRKVVGRLQLKVFDMFVPLIRLIDPFLPWRGLSLIVIARPAGKP